MTEHPDWFERLPTRRLALLALTPLGLQTYLTDAETLEGRLGLRLSRPLLTPIVQRAIGMKLDKMAAAEPVEWAWLTYWLVVVRELKFGAGMIGFKGSPDPAGQVEIGYGIDPTVASQGYTTEAAAALVEWAFANAECLLITAPDTKRDNPASHRVLAKLGMRACAEDDQAISYQLTRADFLQRPIDE